MKNWIAIAALTTLAGTAQASLVSLGNGTVLDTTTDLVWLQDWNVNGAQDWATQVAWANGLTFAGNSDWVLPSIGNYTTLYNEVGNLTLVNVFTDVQAGYTYWTSDSYNSDNAVAFGATDSTIIPFYYKPAPNHAVAVHAATVADLALVPEPQTLALALLGLGALLATHRKRAR